MAFLFFKRRRVKPIFVGSNGNDLTRGIYVFHLDIDNGEILKKKFYKSLANPTSIFKRERYIFVCYKNKTGRPTDGGIWQYASMDLQFGLTAKVTNHGKTYVWCYVNPDRSYAYAVDYYNSEVVVVPILKQKIVKVVQTIKHVGHGPDPKRQSEAHPCFIDQTPDGKWMVVCDLGTDEIVFYDIGEKGRLSRNDELSFHVKPGSGPKKIIFSPDGQYAYVLNELTSMVNVYRYQDGHMTLIQEIVTYPTDEYVGTNTGGDILMNDSGDYLLVSNCGHDSVTTFEVDIPSGMLTKVDVTDTDEKPVQMIIVDNRFVVVASQKGGSIESFEIKRGESKGVLFETHFSYMVGEPVCLIEGRGI